MRKIYDCVVFYKLYSVNTCLLCSSYPFLPLSVCPLPHLKKRKLMLRELAQMGSKCQTEAVNSRSPQEASTRIFGFVLSVSPGVVILAKWQKPKLRNLIPYTCRRERQCSFYSRLCLYILPINWSVFPLWPGKIPQHQL